MYEDSLVTGCAQFHILIKNQLLNYPKTSSTIGDDLSTVSYILWMQPMPNSQKNSPNQNVILDIKIDWCVIFYVRIVKFHRWVCKFIFLFLIYVWL